MIYPPGTARGSSEMVFAKRIARGILCNIGMDCSPGLCYPHMTGWPVWCTHMRLTGPNLTGICPAASYYVWRTLATVTDDFYAREFPVSFENPDKFMCFTFESGDKSQLLVAAWYADQLVDGIAELRNDVTLPGVAAQKVVGIDTFNGTEQELNVSRVGDDLLLKGLLIKDYPVFIRIVK